MLVSSALVDLVRDADEKGADFVAPARHSNFEVQKNIHWSYGPLMAFRRAKYDTVIADVLRGYLRDSEKPVPAYGFDEWGFRRWGGAGYENSLSGLLDDLISQNLLTPYDLPPEFPTVNEPPFFDGCCKASRRHIAACQPVPAFEAGQRSSCGYCKYNDTSGVAELSAVDDVPYVICHFQYAKHDWPPDEATYHAAALLAASTSTFLTPSAGVWFTPVCEKT